MAVTNDVVKGIAKKLGWTPRKSEAVLADFVKEVGDSLADGIRLELEDFGKFKLQRLPDRKVVTMLGGHKREVALPASVSPHFEPAGGLAKRISLPKLTPSVPHKESSKATTRARRSDVRFAELIGRTIPKEILALVPESIARKYQVVPFGLQDKTLMVAMIDPENEEAFNALRKVSRKIIEPYIATQDDLNFVLDQYTALQGELKDLLADAEEEEGDVETVEEKEATASEEETDETSPAAKIVSTLLKRAVREKASDIHIEPTDELVQVRFRVDGVLQKILTLPKEVHAAVISRVKILSNLKIDETRLPQDGRIQILLDGRKIDFRISLIPTVNGEKVVARVLDHSSGGLTLEELGVDGRAFDILENDSKKAHGMILVTGPTGSGKSTTLYAIVSRIKSDEINIITMEDPVEYRMSGVNQCQVNSAIGYTFASGLRSILRQDPNVIMVGEIRDKETADIAINAALTGHIVISTLHTNDAAGAIPRLIDMGIEPFLITSSMNAIVAQRLCRKICEKCKEETPIKPEDSDIIAKAIEGMPDRERSEAQNLHTFFVGKGCSACGNTGYHGRIGIFEVMDISDNLKQLTIKRASSEDLYTEAKKGGFIDMKEDGILKALRGETTIEEVWRVTKD